jgi:hypothetical protein
VKRSEQAILCPCGKLSPHVFAVRLTLDEKTVSLWTDGTITQGGRFGMTLRGLGHPRSATRARAQALALRLIADDVSLYAASSLPSVLRLAADTYAHDYINDDYRRSDVRSRAHRRLL